MMNTISAAAPIRAAAPCMMNTISAAAPHRLAMIYELAPFLSLFCLIAHSILQDEHILILKQRYKNNK